MTKLTDAIPAATEYVSAVQRVVDAVVIKGPNPAETDAAMNKLRHDWPTLGNAIDLLVAVHSKVLG